MLRAQENSMRETTVEDIEITKFERERWEEKVEDIDLHEVTQDTLDKIESFIEKNLIKLQVYVI